MTNRPSAPGPPGRPPLGVEDLLPLVYQELRDIAHRERRRLFTPDTLATTGLVHECFLRLADSRFESRGQFLRIAAVAMRRILIDRVRAQLAAKRGGHEEHVDLDDTGEEQFVVRDEEIVLAVHEALEGLASVNPRLVELVECRFFAGYSEVETAEALGISERTVQREWAAARAWLRKELGAGV